MNRRLTPQENPMNYIVAWTHKNQKYQGQVINIRSEGAMSMPILVVETTEGTLQEVVAGLVKVIDEG